MDKLESAMQMVLEELRARMDALQDEVDERMTVLNRLRSIEKAIQTPPLWGTPEEDAVELCVVVRDDEFGHLTMAQAATEVLKRAGTPLHAKDIWFSVMRGGYPHHSKSSFQSLVTCMNRLRSQFTNTGRNTFALATAASKHDSKPAAQGRHANVSM